MADESQRWSLAFRDAALERAYQKEQLAAGQTSYRVLASIALLQWIAVFPLDRATSGSSANLNALLFIRYAVALPVALAATALGWKSRYRPAAVVVVAVAYFCSPLLMGLVVPEPGVFDATSASGATMVGIVGSGVMCAVWGVRFELVAFGLVPVFMALALAFLHRYAFPSNGILLFSATVACMVTLIVHYMIDHAKRSAFIATRRLERERERSEGLLRNMLPEAVAQRLKDAPSRIAEHFEEATVLFADIAGFTPLSAELSPTALVEALDEIFTGLDEIAHRRGLEKIKTIGDAYMVVGGVPAPRADHVEAIAELALEMRDFVASRSFVGGRALSMRLGIHTGPVVAGVIGKKRLAYDLWGDTVNTASRMESHGEPGKVHVSRAVYERLRARFLFEARGAIDVKGKGAMETWFLVARSDMAAA